MFKKLVSQLSLSPSAVSQLSFYARRLRQERVTRTFSAIAAVLVILLQLATVAAPPSTANAASPNDIIYGGVVSKDDLLNRFDSSEELRDIYGHWGVTRSDIEASKLTTINSLDLSLKSLGRLQHLASDTPIVIDGVTYWQRVLHTWDTGSFVHTGSTYQVFEGTRSDGGGFFAIMLACGNIVVKTNPTPIPSITPTPLPTPKPSPKPSSIDCDSLTATPATGLKPLTVSFLGEGDSNNDSIAKYVFNFGDKTSATLATSSTTHKYQDTGPYTATLQLIDAHGKETAIVSNCSVVITPTTPPAQFLKHKSALNLTQNIDATTKPAQPGDVIQYTLTTKNVGGTSDSYVVTEHLEDVLEYADVTDTGGGTLTDGVMSWPVAVIKPGETLTKTFQVTVKNPVPATPVGESDPYSYDLNMDNVYGNAVRIAVQPPTAKLVEAASTSLPQTGPGESSTIVLIVVCVTIYFYLRNRQLAKEVKLLRHTFEGGVDVGRA